MGPIRINSARSSMRSSGRNSGRNRLRELRSNRRMVNLWSSAEAIDEHEAIDRDEVEARDTASGNSHKVVQIPCGHVFHYKCMVEWTLSVLSNNRTSNSARNFRVSCPVCRLAFELECDI